MAHLRERGVHALGASGILGFAFRLLRLWALQRAFNRGQGTQRRELREGADPSGPPPFLGCPWAAQMSGTSHGPIRSVAQAVPQLTEQEGLQVTPPQVPPQLPPQVLRQVFTQLPPQLPPQVDPTV